MLVPGKTVPSGMKDRMLAPHRTFSCAWEHRRHAKAEALHKLLRKTSKVAGDPGVLKTSKVAGDPGCFRAPACTATQERHKLPDARQRKGTDGDMGYRGFRLTPPSPSLAEEARTKAMRHTDQGKAAPSPPPAHRSHRSSPPAQGRYETSSPPGPGTRGKVGLAWWKSVQTGPGARARPPIPQAPPPAALAAHPLLRPPGSHAPQPTQDPVA
eukprot:1160106-Pelagomonas_calceolata.AAC.3